jgi:hypothetical protein
MRTSIRLVTSSALGAILMLSLGVGATLAAPAPQKPTVQVIDLGEDWCFDDSVDLYCNVQTGTLTIKEWTDGSSESRVDMVTKTVVTHDGAFVARYERTVKDQTRFGADGSYSTDSVERTTWTDGSKQCATTSHFKRIDFDVKIDTLKSNCD